MRKINEKLYHYIENCGEYGKRLSERDKIYFGTCFNYYKYRGYTLLKKYQNSDKRVLCIPLSYSQSQTTCNRMNAFIDFYGYSDNLVYRNGKFYLKVLRDSYSCKDKKVLDFFLLPCVDGFLTLSNKYMTINGHTIKELNDRALSFFEGVKLTKQKYRQEKRRLNKDEI